MSSKLLKLCSILALAALTAAPLQAGNPFAVDTSGRLIAWRNFPIQVIYDQGTLGNLSNTDAVSLAQEIFTRWQNVATARLTFQNAGMTSQDITTSNFTSFFSSCTTSESANKFVVVFDTDGSIIDQVFGSGQKDHVLGFAGPRCLAANQQTGQLAFVSARAVLNGFVLTRTNPVSTNDMKRVTLHEVGHALGLDHSQLNANLRFSSNPADRATVPLMYPFLVSGLTDPLTLALDDSTEISTVNPGTGFASQPSLTGTVLLADGQTAFIGANVVARNVNDSNTTAAANVSGTRFASSSQSGYGSSDPQFKGQYEFWGLPAGNYTISVETIESRFTSGSSVGPLDPPFPLPYTPVTTSPVAVATGSTTTQNVLLAPSAALPSLTNLTIIPHFAIGGGFVTRVFVRNLSTSSNNVIVQYMNQNGTVSTNPPSSQLQMSPGQVVEFTSGESNRSSALKVQWIAIGSDQTLQASVLFDCCAADTTTQTVGVLPQNPATTFSTPFIFQRQTSSQPILVYGLAVANRSESQANTITVTLRDQNNTQVSQDTVTISAALGQTAFTPSDLTNAAAFLQGRNSFLGSMVITGTQQFSAVVVGNLGTRFFSLPLTPQ